MRPTRRSRRVLAATSPPDAACGALYGERINQLDVRVAKKITLTQRVRLQANFNIYNLFNGSASSTLNTNFGPLWLQPSLLQDGRMIQFRRGMSRSERCPFTRTLRRRRKSRN